MHKKLVRGKCKECVMEQGSSKVETKQDSEQHDKVDQLSEHEVWTLALIAEHGDEIPEVLQSKGLRKKSEKRDMRLYEIEDSIYKLLGKKLIARPKWFSVFTKRYFATDEGFAWLEKQKLMPKKVRRKPVLTDAELARVRRR